MESTSRSQPCPCSYKQATDSMGFQKIVESKDGGLAIYRYVPETHNVTNMPQRQCENGEAFILRNTKNGTTSEDFNTTFEQNKLTCPRCIKIVKHAQSLLTNVQSIDIQDLVGICDHCRLKERLHHSCCKCKEMVKKFKTNTKQEREVQRQRVNKWLTQVQHLLRNSLADEIEEHNKSKLRARSELSFDKLFSEFNKSESKYFKAEPRAEDRLETSDRRLNTSRTISLENLEGANTVSKEYLKRVVSPDKHIEDTSKPSYFNLPEYKHAADISKPSLFKLPEDTKLAVNNFSKERTEPKIKISFLETSEEYAEHKRKRKKPGILKSHEDEMVETQKKHSSKDDILKARSEQDLSKEATKQDFILKSKIALEDVLMPDVEKGRLLSLEMPWFKSASEQDLSRGFSFLFPKEKIELQKRHISSSELIKDFQDTQKTKAEEEKRKREEELKRKQEEKERRKLEREEKLRIETEIKILADKEEQRLHEEKLRLTKETTPVKTDPDEITSASSIATKKLAATEAQRSLKDEQNKEEEDQIQQLKNDKELKDQQKNGEGQSQQLKRGKEFKDQQKKEEENQTRQLKRGKEIKDEQKRDDDVQTGQLKRGKEFKDQQKKEEENQTQQLKKVKEEKLQKQKLEGQENVQKDKENKIQKKKLEGQENLQKDKEDKIQKKKLEEQDRLTKKKDISKQDETGIDKESIQAEKSKFTAEKLSEKEAVNTLKDQQKKEKEDQILKAKNEKLNEQEKLRREKAETVENQNESRSKPANKDNSEKNDTFNKKDTSKIDEKTEKASNEKNVKEEKHSQSAANEALKSLLALQEKDKAEREKLKKQQEIDKELAEKKAKETENNVKVDENKKAKNKSASKFKNKESTPEKERSPTHKPESPTQKDLAVKDVKVKKPSGDDLILRLVNLKQSEPRKETFRFSQMKITPIVVKKHAKHKCRDPKCLICRDSDLGLAYDEIIADTYKGDEINDIIIGEKIYKNKTPFKKPEEKEKVPTVQLLEVEGIKDVDVAVQETVAQTIPIPTKPLKGKNDVFDPEASKGVIRYALSDRTFIDKGWTMLPTEKVVRKMNVYRMRPAHPEFDWFEHNKYKRVMQYDTGEKLAEFDDNGRGRWFYRSGKLALDYYDAEEINAQQRFVVYSSGELDERGRIRPRTILATFDYLGNGIVFDHAGKIRLKYNQTEGVVLDRSIGPVSQWKWHTLNDPPVLQQVMIDTQMPYKDPTIMKLGGPGSGKKRVDNEEMLAIEFDNFIKEKSRKLTQKFKPFQIKMKALKINEYFSLRVLDQATVYLLFRDGTTNLKINMGMILDHKEIVDTDTADVGDVSNSMERFPARTDSLAVLQQAVAQAQREERLRVRHERRLHKPAEPCASSDQLTAAVSRPLRPALITASSGTTLGSKQCPCKFRKPSSNLYYDTRL